MAILVQDIHGIRGLPGLELVGGGGSTDAWRNMETVAHVPVRLNLGICHPQPFDVIFGRLDVLALSANHFRPSAVDGCRCALRIQSGIGEDTEVVADRALFDQRHSPQAAPLHSNQPLLERRGIPPEGWRIGEHTTGSVQLVYFLVSGCYALTDIGYFG